MTTLFTFPDDLLEAANLKPGDEIEWVDRNDGTFILRKPNVI
jgi:bifunctional DNA-binding transcriptional regulator/antitoxin component of YhaV-PrlF toxin-antitoxin module